MSSDSTFFIETSAQSAVNQLASNEKTKLQKRLNHIKLKK
ncbi:hypothetical protein BATR1942_17135 [Bacillus atrophaeus 1942]|uniref:Uncharacterized protein n=1 Tax=Bacillus atrophaeus (strain 1942) TaxID=720555 RepID=A0ABM5M2B0_BACA1|nr:hypothetical protein BATR1942_17135 [Bacillus atrophaeus 1942]